MTSQRPARQPTGHRADRLPARRAAWFLGPACVAAVAYVDPGNFATNVTAGARYGFALLWVVVAASAVAMLVQYLSAKLGIATGMSLPELCRERLGRPARIGLWLQAEVVVVMTDLAEVVGGALGLQLLFGVPLWAGGLLTAGGMLLILMLRQRGRRRFEAVVAALLTVVLAAFVYQTLRARVDASEAVHGLVPGFPGQDGALLAVGIVGATVMPHAIYLHSALTQELLPREDSTRRKLAVRMSMVDVVVALGVAAVVNAAILMAATPLRGAGVDSLADAHTAFGTAYGSLTAAVFGVGLLASGLAASCVGVYSGQIVMQGFLRRSIPLWLRRLVSLAPAIAVLLLGVDPTRALLASQVVVSFGVPFALVPLVVFTGNRALMGELVNRRGTLAAATSAAVLIIALNAYLVVRTLR
ncbi:Nramp family divalent metal transporter [Streptomyces carpinensis]|nr:Nramp family divalent metal transporter [Streptomyces carpinensis]